MTKLPAISWSKIDKIEKSYFKLRIIFSDITQKTLLFSIFFSTTFHFNDRNIDVSLIFRIKIDFKLNLQLKIAIVHILICHSQLDKIP